MITDTRLLETTEKIDIVETVKNIVSKESENFSLEDIVDAEDVEIFEEKSYKIDDEIKKAVEDIVQYSDVDFIEKRNSILYSPSDEELKNTVGDDKKVSIYGTDADRSVIAEYNIAEDKTTYHIFYGKPIEDYFEKRHEEIRDTANLVPLKNLIVDKFPGLYGWTILTDNVMGLDKDNELKGPEFKKMVYVHEAIHTPDEFETRIITDWIMSKEMPLSYQLAGQKKFL